MAETTNEKTMNLALGANFTLLGAELSAAYAKVGNGHKILITPTRPDVNSGISIRDIVNDVNAMIQSFSGTAPVLSESMLQEKFPQQPAAGGWESIRIILSMVYLYYDSEGKVLDYAFKLDIDASEMLPKGISLINISSLSIAVWNTTSKAVVDRMQLYLPEAPSNAS